MKLFQDKKSSTMLAIVNDFCLGTYADKVYAYHSMYSDIMLKDMAKQCTKTEWKHVEDNQEIFPENVCQYIDEIRDDMGFWKVSKKSKSIIKQNIHIFKAKLPQSGMGYSSPTCIPAHSQ